MKLKEDTLKTLKYDTKRIKNKIGVYRESDDVDLNFLEDKLEDLIMQIDQQIEERRVIDRKLKQLPRREMMTWDGNVESYVDFKRQMTDMLIYDSESLNLSILKAQIYGKDKPFIEDLLYNLDSIAEAFSVLDTLFGDTRTVLPRLRAKLDNLPSHPEREEDEN